MVGSFSVSADGLQTSLSPAEIERELASMWKPGGEADGPGSVTRVVLGNVIWLGSRPCFEAALRLLQRVIPKYPCRLFLLVVDPTESSTEVRASVSAQCFRLDRDKPAVCCEMIQLAFGPGALHHVRGCVAPLLISDLQTVLWRGDGSDGISVPELEEHLDHVVTMASRAGRPAEQWRRQLARGTPMVDLSWYRLAPIRDQVMAFFDDPNTGFDLRAVRRVSVQTVRHPGRGWLPEVMVAVLVGWLATCLRWQPASSDAGAAYHFRSGDNLVEVEVHETQLPEGNEPTLSTVVMEDAAGEAFHLELAAQGRSMEIYTGSCEEKARAVRCLAVSEMGEAEALGAAVNARRGITEFRSIAALALPLLEHLTREQG